MTGFDFDTPIGRQDIPFLKTHPDVLGQDQGPVFAGGVADMDFQVAPPILDALRTRLEPPLFGYEALPNDLLPAVQDWLNHRHGWKVEHDHILCMPYALNGLTTAATLFSKVGEGIIVQPPVFFDFYNVIRENGRTLVSNPLVLRDGRYEMDFDGLEALARDPANTMLFLCNPHNPIGRAWTRDELSTLGEICLRHDVLVLSDEFHADIVYPGQRHLPYAALGPEVAAGSVTLLSPAKTFNIASCASTFVIVPDKARRDAIQKEAARLTEDNLNAFTNVAMLAAYRHGQPWLDALLDYLEGNVAEVRKSVEALPGVSMVEPDATYLVWLDFRGLDMTPDHLHAFLRQKARWAASPGASFGPGGAGFIRLNFACPRQRLKMALDDLANALRDRAEST